MPRNDSATVCVVGGGPAGLMAGLLLARAGVTVTVIEKHPDFNRDFRGDTIHPSTLAVIDELGWLDEFLALPHQRMRRVEIAIAGRRVTVADFARLPTRSRFIAFVPQWDFLSFLVAKARQFPEFSLIRDTAVTGLLCEDGAVVGVQTKRDGKVAELRADLVIGADGRHSLTRRSAELDLATTASPIDVFWFRLPRRPGEEMPLFTGGQGSLISINRGDYWQLAYAFPRGRGDDLRSQGLSNLKSRISALQPDYIDRVDILDSWDDVHELVVRVDRLRRWHRPGLLCIGDAAHAMSPAGGVGINLAVQDAVATANELGPILAERTPSAAELDRIRRRRSWAVRGTQAFQSRILSGLYTPTAEGGTSTRLPAPLWILDKVPLLRHVVGRFIGLGLRPEHVHPSAGPESARPRR